MANFEFDKLYCISDIHLGGVSGFQVFNSGDAFSSFIDLINEQSDDSHVALVLNGDVVDFLAEQPAKYIDAKGACAKLQRIFTDTAFIPVWEGLERFVKTAERQLIIVLGNHDIELALPQVQSMLIERLCGGDNNAINQLHFAMDGAGFACKVGRAEVLCMHGNEVDGWNVIDYGQITELKRALNRKMELPNWMPCAGAKLVVDGINHLKPNLRWIDLLKPEVEAVFPLVLALAGSDILGKRLKSIPSIVARKVLDDKKIYFDLLSADEQIEVEDKAFRDATGRFSRMVSNKVDDELVDELFESTETHKDPFQVLDESEENEQLLGVFDAVIEFIRGKPREEIVRALLKDVIDADRSFDAFYPDKTFNQIDEKVGPEVDFILAGHTHLRRALNRNIGAGYYFNSGTWMRLMSLKSKDFEQQRFKEVWKTLRSGSLESLERSNLVKNIRTVICIEKQPDSSVKGCLKTVKSTTEGGYALELLADSEKFI